MFTYLTIASAILVIVSLASKAYALDCISNEIPVHLHNLEIAQTFRGNLSHLPRFCSNKEGMHAATKGSFQGISRDRDGEVVSGFDGIGEDAATRWIASAHFPELGFSPPLEPLQATSSKPDILDIEVDHPTIDNTNSYASTDVFIDQIGRIGRPLNGNLKSKSRAVLSPGIPSVIYAQTQADSTCNRSEQCDQQCRLLTTEPVYYVADHFKLPLAASFLDTPSLQLANILENAAQGGAA